MSFGRSIMSVVRNGAQRASRFLTGAPGDPQVRKIGPRSAHAAWHAGGSKNGPRRTWRRPRIAILVTGLALFAGLAGSSPSAAATPTITVESQAWWRADGITVPSHVGAHIHAKATLPADGHPVTGRLEIPVTITLHDARGSTNWFRIGTEAQELFQRDLSIGPCDDCAVLFTATIDLSGVPTGRHEFRLSANNPDEDPDQAGDQRMFQSTGYQICVRSCTPSYRDAGVQIEARGWYTGVEYQNARLDTDPSSIRSGGLIDVRLGPGVGGAPTRLAGVYIDPDFHAGRAGTVVREWTGAFSGSVRIPNVAPGPHKLVLLSSDGQNAGVLAVQFTQGTTADPTPAPAPTPAPDPTQTPAPDPTLAPAPTPAPAPSNPPDATPTPASSNSPDAPSTPASSNPPEATPTPAPSNPEAATVTTRIADSSRRITYNGRWATARHPSYFGGSVHWTTSAGAKATLVFDGNRIRWIGPTGPTRGRAKVYIDGRLTTTVNLYSARFHARRVLVSASVADGRHRITIVAMATPRRPMVAIDAFEVVDPR